MGLGWDVKINYNGTKIIITLKCSFKRGTRFKVKLIFIRILYFVCRHPVNLGCGSSPE